MDRIGRARQGRLAYKIIYSGRLDNKHQDGVALIMKKEAARAMIGYAALRPRTCIIKARFRTSKGRATVIQVYALTSNSIEGEIDDFYREYAKPRSDYNDGDFSAKVGKDSETWRGAI